MKTNTMTWSRQVSLQTGLVLVIMAALLAASPASALVKRPAANSAEIISARGMVATATFTLGTPCSPFLLDWGDGEKTEQVVQKDMMCIQVLQEVTKRHTYDQAGTYEILLTYGGNKISKEITVVAQEQTFTIDDIRSVTSLWVDPNEMLADEEYTIYTITLKDDSVVEVNAGGFTTKQWRDQQFVDAGYVGDIDALIDMAEPETIEFEEPAPQPEEADLVRIGLQERIIDLLNQIISFLKVGY